MEDCRLDKSNQKQPSYTEVFEEYCPFCIAIGMTYREFWYEDCWIANTYLKAYKIKKELKNEELWLQGVYIYEALCDVSPVMHAFSKKGTKPRKYSTEPYPLFKDTKKDDEEKKKQEQEAEMQKALAYFESWSKRVSKQMEIKEKK